jgi:lipoprotein-releasing system permease protein
VSALNAQSVSTGADPRRGDGGGGAGHCQRAGGVGGAEAREIGILRAMGATRGQVLRVFLLQGAIVGALGSALGVLLAVALIWPSPPSCAARTALPLFAIAVAPALALQVALVATVCGVLAAVAPARRAAALDPAQAIRM